MNLFDNYTQKVKSSLTSDRLQKSFNGENLTESAFGASNGFRNSSGGIGGLQKSAQRLSFQPEPSLLALNDIVQSPAAVDQAEIGLHPDFKHLKNTGETAYHYITSVFIDIKGSTALHDSYELETVHNVTNTVQSAAIHVCLLMGGHIQRLQGDSVFAYFGGKKISKEESVKQAVQACAMFSYFVKNDLATIFEEEGVENISTRIGIDFGDDNQVLWATSGVGNCTELTTCSLHTSLAAKMQSYAGKHGIIVGQHIKDRLMADEKLFDLVRDSKGEIIRRYIHEGRKKNFYYTQYRLDWFAYLKTLPFIQSDANGNLYTVSEKQKKAERLERLRDTSVLLQSGAAYTDSMGKIGSNPSGIKNHEHRFHHE
jgi:adenylate cyclase